MIGEDPYMYSIREDAHVIGKECQGESSTEL